MRQIRKNEIRAAVAEAKRSRVFATDEDLVEDVILRLGIPIRYAQIGGYVVKKREGNLIHSNVVLKGNRQ